MSGNNVQACGYLLYMCLKAGCRYACVRDSVFLCMRVSVSV